MGNIFIQHTKQQRLCYCGGKGTLRGNSPLGEGCLHCGPGFTLSPYCPGDRLMGHHVWLGYKSPWPPSLAPRQFFEIIGSTSKSSGPSGCQPQGRSSLSHLSLFLGPSIYGAITAMDWAVYVCVRLCKTTCFKEHSVRLQLPGSPSFSSHMALGTMLG